MNKTVYLIAFILIGLTILSAGPAQAAISSTTTLITLNNPSTYGQAVTFLATVAPGATGTVTFQDGAATLGTATLDYDGQATFTTSTLSAGSHTITADYSGSSYYDSSSDVLTQDVNPAASTTTLSGSPNPILYGNSVSFTATVTAGATGTVTFLDGGATMGTATLDDASQATFTTSALTAGSHEISAVYGGDTNYEGSTSTVLTQTVNKKTPHPILNSAPQPSVYGQPVTITVTLPADAIGTVTIKDGSAVLGTGTISGGTVTITTSVLRGYGSYSTLIGYYSGDTNYNAYRSDPRYTHVVYRADTTTTLGSSSNPSLHGSPVTITAVVEAVAPGGGIPVGTVELFDGPGSLGTCALDGTGQATFTATDLSIGSHSLTAVYTGVYYNHSDSTSAPLAQVVSPNIPAASFTANVTAGTSPLAVQFTDMSTTNPTSWQWSFGDGTPDITVQNPVHTFGSPGVYTVTLTATNADGSGSEQKAGFITVTAPTPTPVPAAPPTYGMGQFYPRTTPVPGPSPSPVVPPASAPAPTSESSESQIVSGVPSPGPSPDFESRSGFPWWIMVASFVALGLVAVACFLLLKNSD